MRAPALDAGQQTVIEVLVDLVELGHLEEDGLDLLEAQDGLRGGGRRPQRLHGLKTETVNSVALAPPPACRVYFLS